MDSSIFSFAGDFEESHLETMLNFEQSEVQPAEEQSGKNTAESSQDKDLARKRNTERMRKYRAGLKNKEKELETAVATSQQEIQALRKEHEELKSYNFTLESLSRYKEYFIDRMRGAAATVSKHSTEAKTTLFKAFSQISVCLWEKSTFISSIPDANVRICVKYAHWMPRAVNSLFISRLTTLVTRWTIADTPDAKADIERHIGLIFQTRKRFGSMLYEEYPEKALFLFKNALRDDNLGEIVHPSRVLENQDLLRAVGLRPEQRETLTQYCHQYAIEYRALCQHLQVEAQGIQQNLANSASSSAATTVQTASGGASPPASSLDSKEALQKEFDLELIKLRLKYGLMCMEVVTPLQLAFVSLNMAQHLDYNLDVLRAYGTLPGAAEIREIAM